MVLRIAVALCCLLLQGARAQYIPLTASGKDERVIVRVHPGTATADAKKLVESKGMTFLRDIPELGLILAQASQGATMASVDRLKEDDNVLQVEPDIWDRWIEGPASFQETPFPTSVEPFLAGSPQEQPGFEGQKRKPFKWPFPLPKRKPKKDPVKPPKNPRQPPPPPQPQPPQQPPTVTPPADEMPWGIKKLNAAAAWPKARGTGVKVAIIDTGIDPDHSDLKGRVAGGYNAITKDDNWRDDHYHGTHVAGTVAASKDGRGVAGVAPEAILYSVKVLNKDGQGSLFGIIEGIQWCVKNNIQIANMSLGGKKGNDSFKLAIEEAVKNGLTIVAAAGNERGPVSFPAAYEPVIAVSALDEAKNGQERLADFSNTGPEVDFTAPGVGVISTAPGDAFRKLSGTSMASPHVAGVAALAAGAGFNGPANIRRALETSAVKMGLGNNQEGAGLPLASHFGK